MNQRSAKPTEKSHQMPQLNDAVRGSAVSGNHPAARPRFSLLTRIPLQHPAVTETHIANTVQAGQKLAQTDPGKSVGTRHQDIEMLLACNDGFCSTIVRFARSRDIRARRARVAGSAAS